jgi:hypothetical protein
LNPFLQGPRLSAEASPIARLLCYASQIMFTP